VNEKIDLALENQWEAEPDEELKVPKDYIENLKWEIIVFGKREFTFRCREYYSVEGSGAWTFEGVIIDTSKKDPLGNITLKRITYHPAVSLVNMGFMVIPAPEVTGEGEASSG
jgi:hypothetical protein